MNRVASFALAALLLAAVVAVPLCAAKAATPAEIEASIVKGLAWLATQQNPTDGSWGASNKVAHTGLAVKKFAHRAVELGFSPLHPSYQYYDQVKGGLDYIFSQAVIITPLPLQGVNNPDPDGDGGVYFPSGGHDTYETGIALMAIAESDGPDSVVDVPGSPVDGWTYRDVAVDVVDYLAFGQTDAGAGQGGWGYSHNEGWADNSNSGYAVLGLAYAQAAPKYGFNIPIPAFVLSELGIWIEYIQCDQPGPGIDDGGSGYSSGDPCGWVNTLKTGNLLFEMALRAEYSGTRRDRAIAYLVRHWTDANDDPGWQNHYQAMYCIMKGAEFQGLDLIGGIDWYEDFSDQIVATQDDDGWWPSDYWGDQILSTVWALLTLEKAAPPTFLGPTIKIEKTHNTMQGREEEVSITFEGLDFAMGGFNLLIAYDASALNFVGAEKGQLLEDCGWEYFTFRYGPDGNCGDGCPSGMIRLVAIADLPNNDLPPSCFGPPDTDPHELAVLTFLVTSNMTFEGQYIPITFFWLDCGDNTISSVTGDTLYLDRAIYDFTGQVIWDEEDDVQFPEDARYAYIGAPDSCLVGGGPGKPTPMRLIDFWKGGIDIIPIDSIDARGDINLNGLMNEIGDAVLLANYFIYGPSVWHPLYYEGQIAATDINHDGVVLTVADLVYLIRIITGDASPFPKVSPQQLPAKVDWRIDGDQMVVEFASQADAGGVLLVFDHQGAQLGEPVLTERASALRVLSHDDGTQLRVLLYSTEQGARISAGQGAILAIPVGESAPGLVLAEAEAADYHGNMMTVEIARPAGVPKEFLLFQNVPNPFNASTRIDFNLPQAGNVSLAVYDVLGRKVATLVDGYLEAGVHHLSWNGQDGRGAAAASGVYFYRIITATHQASRRMVLVR